MGDMTTLYNKLNTYHNSDYYPFHMPGHKQNTDLADGDLPFEIDITEIDGFDDLHHASGILKSAQQKAASLYQAEESHFLVNGSTCGIISAIMGCTHKRDKILVARNCHKSIYNAIFMNELQPVYLFPEYLRELELNGEVRAESVQNILEENQDVRAVVIVSPTYDGVVSDVEAIAKTVHEYGIPLIVDEAHGAHFGFHSYFPENANTKGADVVIHSLHKTLPSLTQTALLHMNGELVNRRRIKQYLDIVQSTSPSYVLMASIDSCIHLLEDKGEELFHKYVEHLSWVRAELGKLHCLQLIETPHYDKLKIVVSVKNVEKTIGYTGKDLQEELAEKYHLQMEMAAGSYVIAITSVGDTEEGLRRLVNAFREIDQRLLSAGAKQSNLDESGQVTEEQNSVIQSQVDVVYTSAEMEAFIYQMEQNASSQGVTASQTFEHSIGKISTEYAYVYPPGTPILVPGERVSREVIDILNYYCEIGFQIEGLHEAGRIRCWNTIGVNSNTV